MDGPTLNHYEEQLYSMFKSFDVNNEEALDQSAVHELCDALQLEERGAALVDTLFEKHAGRVTFERFRSGLLGVLGEPATAPRPPDPPLPPAPTASSVGVSDEPSGDLEPRFMLGAKRYGRRSRPPALRAASASRVAVPPRTPSPPRARRSLSAASHPPHPALQHTARIDGEAALALCRDLRMNGVDRRLVERIFEDTPGPDTTVGEFFERLDSTLAREVSGAVDAAAAGAEPDRAAALERLLEEWERSGVRRPRLLLAELGLGDAAPSSAALESALDAELRALPADGEGAGEERARLLTAALVLVRAELTGARRRAEAAAAERDKLRADVAEANARSALIAREVDENHARIEREAKESLRRVGARHAEETRRARADAEAELERGAGERARLEAELARRADIEVRRLTELETMRARVIDLEERVSSDTAALEAGRGERARLLERVRAAEERERVLTVEVTRGLEAREALEELARDHRHTLDRVDELTAALEVTRVPPPRSPAPGPGPCPSPSPAPPCDANLSSELDALLANTDTEKERPDVARSLGVAATASSPPTSPGTVPSPAPPSAPRGQTEGAEEECDRLRELVKELESALEAMRGEYEACEEYWCGKQRDERAAHDAELRAADARLTSLLARVAAYERRLPPAVSDLPTVPELPNLEEQVSALEAEHAAATRALSARLQRAHDQLARAHRRLASLQRRRDAPCPSPAPFPAAGGECARCSRLAAGAAAAGGRALRAETAARRLQARLLAADMLVKELYVENCELARHTP